MTCAMSLSLQILDRLISVKSIFSAKNLTSWWTKPNTKRSKSTTIAHWSSQSRQTRLSWWVVSWSSTWSVQQKMLGRLLSLTTTSFSHSETRRWAAVTTSALFSTVCKDSNSLFRSGGTTTRLLTFKNTSITRKWRTVTSTGLCRISSSLSVGRLMWPTGMDPSRLMTMSLFSRSSGWRW